MSHDRLGDIRVLGARGGGAQLQLNLFKAAGGHVFGNEMRKALCGII